jgi:peptidoglycan/xylan/chitin deacetylase (PgdA/CDA1 family)
MYISACFYYSGVLNLIRWWTRHSGRRLIILYYHQAAGGNLRSHLLYLRRHYRILHLETALEELYTPHKKGEQRKDRRTPLALTFDDGYYDNYTHAFPLACELKIPVTIFLIPGHMESGNSFWWATRLIRFAGVDRVPLEGRTYHLEQQEERKALAQTIDTRFIGAASSSEREEFLASLREILAVPSSAALKKEPAPLLTWTQVREMQKSGWVSFGAHTIHHPDLGNLTNPAEVQREVGECRTTLEQQLRRPAHIFAYPFGHIGDKGLEAVKQAGYDWAVTTISGVNTRRSDPYLLRRRGMSVDKHWLVVAAETAGIWGFFSRLKIDTGLLIRRCLCLSFWKTRCSLRMILKRGNP